MTIFVAVGPTDPPEIHGLEPEYASDGEIDVGCILKDSFPAAQLDFFIDNEPVRWNEIKRGGLDRQSLPWLFPPVTDDSPFVVGVAFFLSLFA